MKRKPPNAGKGRPKGSRNKTSGTIKEAIAFVLESTQGDVLGWLQAVAEGEKEYRFDDEGQPILNDKGEQLFDWTRRPEPGVALKLWSDLSEFMQPKLARTEVTGPRGESLSIAVKFVNARN